MCDIFKYTNTMGFFCNLSQLLSLPGGFKSPKTFFRALFLVPGVIARFWLLATYLQKAPLLEVSVLYWSSCPALTILLIAIIPSRNGNNCMTNSYKGLQRQQKGLERLQSPSSKTVIFQSSSSNPQTPSSVCHLNFGYKALWMTTAFSLYMSILLTQSQKCSHRHHVVTTNAFWQGLGSTQSTPAIRSDKKTAASLAEDMVAKCQGSKWKDWL